MCFAHFFKINGLLKSFFSQITSNPNQKKSVNDKYFLENHSAFGLFGFNVHFYFLHLTPATRRNYRPAYGNFHVKNTIIFCVAHRVVNYFSLGRLRLVAVSNRPYIVTKVVPVKNLITIMPVLYCNSVVLH